jgi:threonine dehydrogenase-like Zn-dependent dehydrogenase
MRLPAPGGELSLPVKYGYCSVGRVRRRRSSRRAARLLSVPHQDRYVVPAADVVEIPDAVPDRRAVLAANMETAVNGLWDAAPLVGSRVAVIGAGAVGLLTPACSGGIPGIDLEVVDISAEKDELCRQLGLRCVRPAAARGACDWCCTRAARPRGSRRRSRWPASRRRSWS